MSSPNPARSSSSSSIPTGPARRCTDPACPRRPKPKVPIKLVTERAVYIPPPPLDTEAGLLEATTTICLQKMMADAFEEGRKVWKENRRRCAMTGEPESEKLPWGPNSTQKKVEEWLMAIGLLGPDADEDDDENDDDIPPSTPCPSSFPSTPSSASTSTLPFAPAPSTPQTPASPTPRRPWHKRLGGLKITIPSDSASSSPGNSPVSPPLSPSPASPVKRAPLTPKKLWSAVQRSTTSLPLPSRPKFMQRKSASSTVVAESSPAPEAAQSTASLPATPVRARKSRPKPLSLTISASGPMRSPSSPRTPSPASPTTPQYPPKYTPSGAPETVFATNLRRVAMLGTISREAAEEIIAEHRAPAPTEEVHRPWWVSVSRAAAVEEPVVGTKAKEEDDDANCGTPIEEYRPRYVPLEDPRFFRWPTPSPSPSSPTQPEEDPFLATSSPTPANDLDPPPCTYTPLIALALWYLFILLAVFVIPGAVIWLGLWAVLRVVEVLLGVLGLL